MLAAGAAPALGQTAPVLIPNVGNFSLPASGPQSAPSPAPTPSPTPAPSATPTPAVFPPPVVETVRAASPAARSTPRLAAPAGAPTPSPVASASAQPAPLATTPVVPTPVASPATISVPESRGSLAWLWATLGALAAGGVGWALVRRRKRGEEQVEEPSPPAAPRRSHPVTGPSGQRPWLELSFRPKRVGTNLLSAAVEYELTLTNIGKVPATHIRAAAELLTAHAGQDEAIATLYDSPVDVPIAPPFALDPGEARILPGFATRPRAEIDVVAARGRPMFVPMVAARVTYDYGDGSVGLATATYVVGVEREGEARMAPIWLDQPPKMLGGAGARAYLRR
ncbi:hypothetical protein BH09PSE4_BH09PSE4_19540 [soil metagenome]